MMAPSFFFIDENAFSLCGSYNLKVVCMQECRLNALDVYFSVPIFKLNCCNMRVTSYKYGGSSAGWAEHGEY